jgi:Dolichyl-phosphate-mannose-protein mannosyltransferase/Tetratricopeptide repeat
MYLGVAALLLAMWVQLALSVHGESLSWDEGDHLFAAYMTATRGDYGLNPEHPPLVKLVAALPLLAMPGLRVPVLQARNFKVEAFLSGKDFNAWNIDRGILFRARLAVTIFPLLLGLLVFLAAREMFNTTAAFIALTLLAFDPTLLAHGAMVTTDVGVSCFILAAVYAFYRYAKAPSWGRVALLGVVTGLGFAAKHTGVLIVPILIALAICEIIRNPRRASGESTDCRKTLTGKMLAALAGAAVISLIVLWAFYGFRYKSRPGAQEINPPLSVSLASLSKPWEGKLVGAVARVHALPESYLYGLADIQAVDDAYTAYYFGKVYPHGTHWYFPGVILIKSTLPFLILMLITAGAIISGKFRPWREILFLTIPPAIYLTVAMGSQMNIGARHIMPVYPFMYILGAGATSALIAANRKWKIPVAALLIWQAVTVLLVFPVYMAYGNEAWGGPKNVHKYLSDSNTDWAQQLIATKKYLDDHQIKDCWFIYFAQGVTDPASYGIPCKLLPTTETLWWLNIPFDVPPSVDGTVLVSDGDLNGFEFGPAPLNPYEAFKSAQPVAIIQNGIDVFQGHFEIPLAAALTHAQNAQNFLAAKNPAAALHQAQQAVALAPESAITQAALGDALAAQGRKDEARAHYEKALQIAKTVQPDFQVGTAADMQKKLATIQ